MTYTNGAVCEYQAERWLPVPGYEGRYMVSDLGRIRSVRGSGLSRRSGRILKQSLASTGYPRVTLVDEDGKHSDGYLHRIVARAFLGEPPPDRPWVNHKDGVKANSLPANLEWCTPSENNLHASRVGLLRSGKHHYLAKSVRRTDRSGAAAFFETQRAAVTGTPGAIQGQISRCCNGVIASHAGYRWEFT